MNLKESIKRILREELSARIKRRLSIDEMENEFLESFEGAYRLTKDRKVLSSHFLDELVYTTISVMMDGVHWRFVSTLPEDEFWYDDIHQGLENHYRKRITRMYNEKQGINESILRETLESKWNKGNYDYQYGYCHYFAYNVIGKIRKMFPKKKVNYYLLLAQEIDELDETIVQDYLVHAYIKIDNMLLDSNGLTTMDEAWKRLEEWEERQRYLVPEMYRTEIFDEETNEIPEYFFNNTFCNTGRVKKDMEEFLNNPIVKRILRDK